MFFNLDTKNTRMSKEEIPETKSKNKDKYESPDDGGLKQETDK